MTYAETLIAIVSRGWNEDEAQVVAKLVYDVSSGVDDIPVQFLADEPGLSFGLVSVPQSDDKASC